ncbi:oxidoreductase [Streptomyces abyssalis]|uniref:Oxidoreductase n=1 Tax=Streptomyces abyssalis TaxID=933944 RepID=A0A1E7JJJ4_9ACTN|nr:PmoA family protein [Streptomyces abyssalis]OEU87282.1 oxidoreductase [Streptomyces abyssalis]OEU87814.1 oxidoreductase [Streptomyces abyssalis]OEV29148.1 oxidoreductase [Streptomyces nanshensis]
MNAPTPLTVTHTHGERVTVTAAGTELMAYVYAPDPVAFESRKPYVHPLRTLAGSPVSGYRPNDHRWHKGLQMTASHLSGQNFWGGNSYVHGEGYLPLHDRVGSMRHDGFDSFEVAGDRLDFTELLTWVENGGEEWAHERRSVALHSADEHSGTYAVDWSIELTNIRGEPLHFGSPTTHGREMAGYTGLHWRGPRDFTGGQVLSPAGPSTDEEMMGRSAEDHPWIGFVGEHDGTDAHSTLVFAHAPGNAESVHASHWFVRSEPVPTVAFSWAFFEEFALPPGDSFAYGYRVLVADGALDADGIERRLKATPW